MATSGTYTFGVTRDDIIRQSMLNIGKLDPYESPDSQQTTDCTIVLNMMCKQWMGKSDFAPGLKVWTRKRGHMFLSSTTGQYTIGPGCATGWSNSYVQTTLTSAIAASGVTANLTSATGIAATYFIGIQQTDGSLFWTTISTLVGLVATVGALPVGASAGAVVFAFPTVAQNPLVIESAVLRDIYSSDTPVGIMRSTQEYDILSNKAQVSFQMDPGAIYHETQLGNSFIYTDAGSAQDVTKHLVLTYQEPVQDFINPLDTPYYPAEYFLSLCWGLSKLIAPQFNRVWTAGMEENWKLAVMRGKNKDPEVSALYFQPGVE